MLDQLWFNLSIAQEMPFTQDPSQALGFVRDDRQAAGPRFEKHIAE